jgi:hypothetical protein
MGKIALFLLSLLLQILSAEAWQFVGAIVATPDYSRTTAHSAATEFHPTMLPIVADNIVLRVGNIAFTGVQLTGRLVDAIINGKMTIEALQDEVIESSRQTSWHASLKSVFDGVMSFAAPASTLTRLTSPLSAIPTFRSENREHVEKFVQHMAKFVGEEKFLLRIGQSLIKRSANVGLLVDGVATSSGLSAPEIIDSPLQSVHIDKRDAFSLPLLDALALCAASSEFVLLKRQAFDAMRSKGMTTQEAMKKLNEPKTEQALKKVAQYVSTKVAEAEEREFAERQLYVDALEDEVEPTLLDSLLQGASVDLSSVAPEQLPLLEDVIAEHFCDQSEHADLMLHILTAELPADVREVAQDYVTERVEMRAEGAVRTLAQVGHALKTAGQMAVTAGKATAVGAAHLLDPIPGAPIGRGVEVLTGTPAKEAYSGTSADAEQYYAVMHSMMGCHPLLTLAGGVVGKVFRNIGRAGRGIQRILANSSLLRKVETRLVERIAKKGSSGVDYVLEAANRNLKLHKNDLRFRGETHTYEITIRNTGEVFKIGESARGVNSLGQSIRAMEQIRKLQHLTGKKFDSRILKIFDGKASARAYETELIKKLRAAGHKLPGNKGLH